MIPDTAEKETSLGKALRLLDIIGANTGSDGSSVAELIKASGLSRPTTYRFLNELHDHGLVQPVGRQSGWQLGPKIFGLAAANSGWNTLRRRARTEMEKFAQDSSYTCHLGIRDGMEVVYIDKLENRHGASMSSVVGQRRPVNVTALGKCLVAFDSDTTIAERFAKRKLADRTPHSITDGQKWLGEIAQVRREGVAYDREECDLGAFCVAAPVLDSHGFVHAAVSISAFVSLMKDGEADHMARAIAALAKNIGFDVP